MNKEFLSILDKSKEIHIKKNQDYTSGTNVDENFERVAEIVSWFNNPIDKSFSSFIAVKLARIASLLNKSSSPNFESIDDTFVDLVTYAGLWGGNVARRLNIKINGILVREECNDSTYREYMGIPKDAKFSGFIPIIKEENKYDKEFRETTKGKKLKEIGMMYNDLDDEDYRELLSLARILKSRKV